MAKRTKSARWIRLAVAGLGVLFLILGLSAGLIYFLVLGEADKRSALHSNLQATIQAFVGPSLDVQLGKTKLAIGDAGLVSVSVEDVVAIKPSSRQVVAQFENIHLGLKIWKTLQGEPSFDKAVVERAWIDGVAFSQGNGVALPTHIKPALAFLGERLAFVSSQSQSGRFTEFELVDSILVADSADDGENRTVGIERLKLGGTRDGELNLSATLVGADTKFELVAAYRTQPDGSTFELEGTGFDPRGWFAGGLGSDGFFSSDAVWDIRANLPFDEDLSPRQGVLNFSPSPSEFKWGRAVTSIDAFGMNVRLHPDKNQIDLERSTLKAGRLEASLLGGVRPADPDLGFAGDIEFELIAETSNFQPTRLDEEIIPAAFSFGGFWRPGSRILDVQKAFMLTNNGRLDGRGVFDFTERSPAVRASAESDGISVVAAKQFWPFFIGMGARRWAHQNVKGGWVENLRFNMDAPHGIVGRLRTGEKFTEDQFSIEAKFRNVSFNSFGAMPLIENGDGRLTLKGMRFDVALEKAEAIEGLSGRARLGESTFSIEDFAELPAQAKAQVSLNGPANILGEISNRKPLLVMDRIDVAASQFSGSAHADIVAEFPIKRGLSEAEVAWNALVDMTDGASSRKISGRILTNAELVIEANAEVARISGTARIDGVPSNFSVVEPTSKNSKYLRKRNLSARLDPALQKKVGLDLSPIIKGPIGLKIEQQEGKKEKQFLDLTDAEINLPWVGWRKGAKIPAQAHYSLKTSKGVNVFEAFEISGEGFRAKGELAFDKEGIVSATLRNVALNRGDDFSLKIKREKSVFHIQAEGESYDARGIMNKLLREGDFAESQGATSVKVNAKVKTLLGFQNLQVSNATALYETDKGRLKSLDVSGTTPENKTMYARAGNNGQRTGFEIRAEDAGHALGFADIYSKMRGGELLTALTKVGDGPFSGLVKVKNFEVIDEPRLAKLVSTTKQNLSNDRDGSAPENIRNIQERRVRFGLARARIVKGDGFLTASDGRIANNQIGLSFEGTVYDQTNRMNISGTFMPAFAINRAVSAIPIIGQLLGNARDSALIGITYRLKGPMSQPTLDLNPISLVTPGIFNRIFEFK